jgi:hypothetical protein
VLAEEAAAQAEGDEAAAATATAAASVKADVKTGVEHLYEVGTFAQVHTILSGDTADSAQLLLLGHRRLKREAIVSVMTLCYVTWYKYLWSGVVCSS